VKIDELKPGDVLLFTGEKGSFISQAIMFLTDSPVSHAALSYTDSAHIVEETPPAIRVSEAKGRFAERDIFVMRSDDLMKEGVVEAATKYLNDKEPYGTANLLMVGFLLLYKKFTPGTGTQKVMIRIMRKLAGGIIDYINKHKHSGDIPMVCSQFVYQCYKDAGHKLNIKGGVLIKAAAAGGGDRGSVLDQVAAHIMSDPSFETEKLFATGQPAGIEAMPAQSDEELAEELLAALQKDKDESAELSRDFVMSVNEFTHAVYTHQAGTMEMLTVPAYDTTALKSLKENEALFVTPGDLLKHCADLNQIGLIKSG